MNDVHNHSKPQPMSSINQCLQLIGSPETGGSGEETGYVISETSIIRMLLNSHNLDAVISFFSDTRKYLFAEFVIGPDFFLLLCHSDMAFINQQRIRAGLKRFLLEFIGFLRCPYLGAEYLGLFILNYTCSPSRNTLTLTTIPIYIQFIQVSMMDSIGRQVNFPIAVL
jgi:hypothetical protein